MPYVRSFDDATPPARFDGVPFSLAHIEESAASAGPWVRIATNALTPLDVDPSVPQPRDLTTSSATLELGYYRIVWEDAAGAQYAAAPVFYTDPASDIRPTVAEVAALERTRTTTGGSGELSTFTADTRPTAVEVEGLIDQALEAILTQLPTALGIRFYAQTRHMVALYTAILIESSYFREQLDEGSVELYRTLLREGMITLLAATTGVGADGEAPRKVDSVMVRSSMVEYDPLRDLADLVL